MKERKFVFVTGGVCSSLGKGIVASSTAAILKSAGIRVAVMKLDPYLNVDPGTMSPFQHGEVFVLNDGAETDLDLGHYERFIDVSLSKDCTVTTGRVYSEVLEAERAGDYLGGTIQVVPHITGKILEKVEQAAEAMDTEVLVVEIGGTVGDIEAEPFMEVLRQMKNKYGKNCVSVHTTLLPYLQASKELKTKPTQLSVRELRRLGIHPDFIFCRADKKIPRALMDKISYFCDVPKNCVIPAETVKSIYEVPLRFQKNNFGILLAEKLNLGAPQFDLKNWTEGCAKIAKIEDEVLIGLAGKYNQLDDAYLSVIEAIKSAGYHENKKVKIIWINTEKIEKNDPESLQNLERVAGVVVPGGFGMRGIEGKVKVAQYCRENKKPYLGICLGSQIMAMDFARNVLGYSDATSEEFEADKPESEKSKHPIIHFIPEQKNIRKKGGTMRLGAYDCQIKPKTKAAECYSKNLISERHRHRYEFNNVYRKEFESAGFCISGVSPVADLVEMVEIENHPFMVGSQFHPEFKSRPFKPHPLFLGFMKAVVR